MAKVIIIHIHNEDPILAEVEEMPQPTDNFIEFTNPRRRDGKAIPYVSDFFDFSVYRPPTTDH